MTVSVLAAVAGLLAVVLAILLTQARGRLAGVERLAAQQAGELAALRGECQSLAAARARVRPQAAPPESPALPVAPARRAAGRCARPRPAAPERSPREPAPQASQGRPEPVQRPPARTGRIRARAPVRSARWALASPRSPAKPQHSRALAGLAHGPQRTPRWRPQGRRPKRRRGMRAHRECTDAGPAPQFMLSKIL
jgi:hypothetical protein